MKWILVLLGLAFVALLGSFAVVSSGVPGSGVCKTETRELDSFDKISLMETGTINVTFGPTQSVSVTTDDNLLQVIETTVENGELKIHPTISINPKIYPVFDIVLPELAAVEIAGSASVNVVNLDAESFDLELNGACAAIMSGTVQNLSVELNGACRAKLKQLESVDATVEINGTGSAEVFASQSIDASASGFATITCYGNPPDVKKEANGVSKVEIVDLVEEDTESSP